MPTTFTVVSLGQLADMDTTEGNTTAENASALVGLTIGGPGNALANYVATLSPGTGGPRGNPDRDRFDGDGNDYYDQNDSTPEMFRIDGGPNQGFDSTATFNATLTYTNGQTAQITAVIFQDVNGNTYWGPEFDANQDQLSIGAHPIQSIRLDSLEQNVYSGMTASREDGSGGGGGGTFVTCYVSGTLIAAAEGDRRIEDLAPGDRVLTRDHGLQPVRWIGRSTVRAAGDLAPIRIAAGSLGQGLPRRDLNVSPQHRMLVRSRVAERMFGSAEVLLPAKKLLDIPGIDRVETGADVTYMHLLLDRHEVIFAEGAPSESFYLGDQAIDALGDETARELTRLFPEMIARRPVPARTIPIGRMMRRLVERHLANGKPMLSAA